MDEISTLQIRVISDQVEASTRRLDALEKQSLRTEKSVDTFGSRATRAFVGIAAGAVSIGALTSVIGAAEREWQKYDVAMKEVSSISGQTAAEFGKMREDVLQLSVAIGVDATTAANGLYEAISAGIPKENAISFLETAGKTAIAGVTDIKTSVDVLTNVINAYKIPVADADIISDKLFTTVKVGKLNMEELSASMAKGTVPAAALGVNFDELMASVASLTLQGTPAAEAFTQINATITALLNPSEEMQTALKAIGFESSRAAVQALGFGDTLERLRGSMDGNDAVMVKAFRSTEAFKGVLSQTGANLATFKNSLDQVRESEGATAKAYKTNAETFANASASMKSEFVALVEGFEGKFHVLRETAGLIKGIALAMSQGSAIGADIDSMVAGGGINAAKMLQDKIAELEAKQGQLQSNMIRGGAVQAVAEETPIGRMLGGQSTASELTATNAQLEKARQAYAAISDEIKNQANLQVALADAQGNPEATAAIQQRIDAEEAASEFKRTTLELEALGAEQAKAATAERVAAAAETLRLDAERVESLKEAATEAKRLATSETEAKQAKISDIQAAKERGLIESAIADEAISKLREEIRLIDEKNARKSGASITDAGMGIPGLSGLGAVLEDETSFKVQKYAEQQNQILAKQQETEDKRNSIITKSAESAVKTMEGETKARNDTMAKGFAEFFGNIAAMQSEFGEKGFKIAQAAAIAQATMKMYEAAVSAYASGSALPGIGVVAGPLFATAALAAGAANIASIKSQSYQAYEFGGMIPAGNVGLVGEAGPEFVRGPAVVTSARATKAARDGSGESGGGKPYTIIVNTPPGHEVSTREDDKGQIVEITVEKVMGRLVNEAENGGGKFVPRLAKNYGLTRKGR